MINSFLSALSFYTRIPVPTFVHHSAETLNRGTKFLPLLGALVGAAAAGLFFLANLVFSVPVAVIISMITTILLTGAFHEDGFADTCDGLGGGWSVEDKLRIMKDSRVGSYGMIGMVMLLLLKYGLLVEIGKNRMIESLILAHLLSRVVPVFLIAVLPYVRLDETSKVKPVAKKIGIGGLFFTLLTGAAGAVLFNVYYLFLLAPAALLILVFALWYRKSMGGYTGDMLGASQQVSEVVLYGSIIGLWNYFL